MDRLSWLDKLENGKAEDAARNVDRRRLSSGAQRRRHYSNRFPNRVLLKDNAAACRPRKMPKKVPT
jgi:hypothetical protein